MSRTCVAIAVTMLLMSGMAAAMGAEPHTPALITANAPDDPADRSARATMKMEAWLRRLVGRYFVFEVPPNINGRLGRHFRDGKLPDGTVATWFVDCTAVGSGPGVFCIQYSVIDGSGQEIAFRFHALFQFGIDPNASKIRMLMVRGGDGVVGESSSHLAGDAVNWMGMSCKQSRVQGTCEHTLRISAPAEGNYFIWTYGTRMQSRGGSPLIMGGPVYLYRITPEDGIGPDGLPHSMAEPSQDLDDAVDRRVRRPFPR